ncbi:MAG: hypothetical protein EHM86_02315 [Desulfobulbaceae bacterium]|nr:MAG: hypothetical protein EHM86_02315 [Desulfobulbaceae bacterium]
MSWRTAFLQICEAISGYSFKRVLAGTACKGRVELPHFLVIESLLKGQCDDLGDRLRRNRLAGHIPGCGESLGYQQAGIVICA